MSKRAVETDGSMGAVLAELEKQISLVQPRLPEKRRPFIIEFAVAAKNGAVMTSEAKAPALREDTV